LTVAALPALVDPGTGTAPVRLASAAPISLPVGTTVQVAIEAERHAGVIAVPAVAIVRDGDDTAVFVVAGGKAQRRAVRTGLSDGTHVEILSGVAAGDAVIVDGQAGLPDGATIQLTRREATP
jgi:multidrug efflux pump subunit AcrA (membrane-fusion protein)